MKELPVGCKNCQSTFPCDETCGADPFAKPAQPTNTEELLAKKQEEIKALQDWKAEIEVEKADNHARAEEIITARELHIERLFAQIAEMESGKVLLCNEAKRDQRHACAEAIANCGRDVSGECIWFDEAHQAIMNA